MNPQLLDALTEHTVTVSLPMEFRGSRINAPVCVTLDKDRTKSIRVLSGNKAYAKSVQMVIEADDALYCNLVDLACVKVAERHL